MRLTLRTLLAYLDDRLPPSQAREIGQKIHNSPFTMDLVERIREVKRKRRLAGSEERRETVDPNLIAEYLDDQLTPELVARVEREILASDVLLAEVAASHEILGLLRDPVAIDSRLQDRLLSLDPTGVTDLIGITEKAGRTSPQPTTAREWTPLSGSPAPGRRWTVIGVAALAILWLASLATDSLLTGPVAVSNQEQSAEGDKNGIVAADSEADNGDNRKADGSDDAASVIASAAQESNRGQTDGASDVTPETSPSKVSGESNELTAQNTNQTADESAPSAATSGVSAEKMDPSTIVSNNNSASGSAGEQRQTPLPAGENPVDAASGSGNAVRGPTPAWFFQADSRSVLILDGARGRWTTLQRIPGGDEVRTDARTVDCEPLVGGNWFGVPAGFTLTLQPRSAGWSATLLGPGLVRIRRGTPSGLDVYRGRLILERDITDTRDPAEQPQFILGADSNEVTLELLTAESRLAMDVSPIAAAAATNSTAAVPGVDEKATMVQSVLPADSDRHVSVALLTGEAALTGPGNAEPVRLNRNQRVSWRYLSDGVFSDFSSGAVESLASLPPWYFENWRDEIPEVTRLKGRLTEALSRNAEPGDAVWTLLDDRNALTGIQAVSVMDLTMDSDRLLSVLFDVRDESIHRAAIDGLSEMARSSLQFRRRIRDGLKTRLSETELDITMNLIIGLNEIQAADPVVATDLIFMLNSDRLSARTLAIYRMEQITKDRRGYHPAGEASRRKEAIRRWQRYLDMNGGRLRP